MFKKPVIRRLKVQLLSIVQITAVEYKVAKKGWELP
jgi:hypothetical protein